MARDEDVAELFELGRVDREALSPTRQSDSAANASSKERVNRECNTDPPRRVLGLDSRTSSRVVSPYCNSSSRNFCKLLVGRAQLGKSGTVLRDVCSGWLTVAKSPPQSRVDDWKGKLVLDSGGLGLRMIPSQIHGDRGKAEREQFLVYRIHQSLVEEQMAFVLSNLDPG